MTSEECDNALMQSCGWHQCLVLH